MNISKSFIYSLAFITMLISGSQVQAQFPLRYNFGGTSGTCGDFSGSNTYNITSTGNIPYEPGVSVISGKNIEIYAPNDPIIGAGANACMYQNELYGKHHSDLVVTVCDLPVGQEIGVVLHFAELYFGITGPGQRQFDILIDGVLKQAAFDNWAEGNALNGGNGGNYVAVDKPYNILIGASGCVEITLRAIGIENPRINGVSFEENAISFPVEMLSFEAKKLTDNQALLTWATAQELNNAGFEVQYSQDGVNFNKAGFVEGAGTTTEVQQYQFSINGLESGRYSFRLKQIDFDGAYEYSRMVELTLQNPQAYSVSSLYPNPASVNSRLFISVEERQLVQVQLFSLNGQQLGTVYREIINADQAQEISIDTSMLTPGAYLLVASGNAFRETFKLLVQ